MSKYTPGPWLLDQSELAEGRYHTVDAGRGYDSDDDSTGFWISAYMPLADAKLIAAAPDLAEALQYLLSEAEAWGVKMEAFGKAREALTKAGL